MMDVGEEYKNRMRNAPDDYLPGNEWDTVDELLANSPDGLDTILEWIFSEHKGYVEPRARAGERFLERNPTRGWLVLERLLSSNDPDDRDTAITVLGRTGDRTRYYLARPLLRDPYGYLQYEAVELLMKDYPEEVRPILQELARQATTEWEKEAAQKLLLALGEEQQVHLNNSVDK
jgi:HEAT repeat protein